jgi:ferric-dicitrate binding protein FerR (iron transport regulator)
MNEEEPVLDAIRRATAADPDQIARTKARALADLERVNGLLRAVPAEPSAAFRVRRRVLQPAPSRFRPPVLIPALAAAALLALLAREAVRDPAIEPTETTTPAEAIARDALITPTDLLPGQRLQLTPEVHLIVEGRGAAQGSRGAPDLRWHQGRLDLDIRPDQGIHLVLTTPEGEITVLGTQFSVQRGPLGTSVEVRRGKVQVSCIADEQGLPQTHLLTAEQAVTCWPTRPAGLLARARALHDAGSPDGEVEAIAERALLTADAHVRGELLALQLDIALRREEPVRALSLAATYLAEGHTARRDDIAQRAVALRRQLGCSEDAADACPPR